MKKWPQIEQGSNYDTVPPPCSRITVDRDDPARFLVSAADANDIPGILKDKLGASKFIAHINLNFKNFDSSTFYWTYKPRSDEYPTSTAWERGFVKKF